MRDLPRLRDHSGLIRGEISGFFCHTYLFSVTRTCYFFFVDDPRTGFVPVRRVRVYPIRLAVHQPANGFTLPKLWRYPKAARINETCAVARCIVLGQAQLAPQTFKPNNRW